MTKHWIRFLPECGGIKTYAEEAEHLQRKIADLKKEVTLLESRLEANEKSALAAVLRDWNSAEVEEAKQKALVYQSETQITDRFHDWEDQRTQFRREIISTYQFHTKQEAPENIQITNLCYQIINKDYKTERSHLKYLKDLQNHFKTPPTIKNILNKFYGKIE